MKEYKRVYAKIDLDAILFNLNAIEKMISKDTQIVAVIKTDGYGHGAVVIAREIENLDTIYGFAVATAEEAFALRKHGIKKPILILGYTFAEEYDDIIKQQIRPTVYSYEMAKNFSDAAIRMGQSVSIHIKLDTGMSRIGYQVTAEAADEIAQINRLPGIIIEGLFTHFAKADELDKTFTLKQIESYQNMLDMLKERRIDIPLKHCSNSAGIIDMPSANMNLVRAGIILYGLWPSDEVHKEAITLKPAMELKSTIVHIKDLDAGRSISYGGTYQLVESRRIATIPVGYGDGYPRSLSNQGYVLIYGKKAPILGRICMDQLMVDVTEIPEAKMLDTVTLLGEDQGNCITMEELAEMSGRFNYEFACDIGKRIPRIFYKNRNIIATSDYFDE